MSHLKLQTKFFLAYLLLALLILSVFGLFFYVYVSEQLILRETNSLTALNSAFKTQVDSIIEDLDNVSININYSNLVKDKISSSSESSVKVSIDDARALIQLFVAINGTDIKADQLVLYDLKGNKFQVGITTSSSTISLEDLEWFEQVKELNGTKLLSEPYYLSSSSNYSGWAISLYRTYYNQYGVTSGAIEVSKNCKTIFKSIISYRNKTDTPPDVYIYNENGELLYPYNLDETKKDKLTDYFSLLPAEGNTLSLTHPNTNVSVLLTCEKSAYTKWTYVTIQKEAIILAPVNNMLKVLFAFTFLLVCISIVISYNLSRSLVKPIKHLKHIIQGIELDTLGEDVTDAYSTPVDELQELFQAFQSMSTNLKVSMNDLIDTRQQELKSRTLALQSQINPHFYYNTISSIIVLAENNLSEEVIRLCRNLTQIMRYITDNSAATVNLEEEITYVSKYLYCMKVRYQSSLTYSIDIDSGLNQIQIPKLLIQPIAENAIKYGITGLPPWNISIIGRIYEDYWKIEVIDSGNGFTKEAIELIDERIKLAVSRPGMPEMKIDGLGLINVYLRWKLYCGERMIFEYGNTKEGHGKVSIGCKRITGGNIWASTI